jgi:RNA polymerase sigma factor (TIGR02999 family)
MDDVTPQRRTLDDVYAVVYEELRRLAASIRRGEGSGRLTLTPTALVNEAWLKLAHSPDIAHTSRTHFKRIAGRAMRQVLVEAARRRTARKRAGGAAVVLVPFDESTDRAGLTEAHILALDGALRDLARMHPRQAAVVEGRFFGGLDTNELAELLNVSPSTIGGDWRLARAWLSAQLRTP